MKIQPYDFAIKYVPGIKILITDALSRVGPHEKAKIEGLHVPIHKLTSYLVVVHVKQIQKATQGDETHQIFIQKMVGVWPACSLQEPIYDSETFLATER